MPSSSPAQCKTSSDLYSSTSGAYLPAVEAVRLKGAELEPMEPSGKIVATTAFPPGDRTGAGAGVARAGAGKAVEGGPLTSLRFNSLRRGQFCRNMPRFLAQ